MLERFNRLIDELVERVRAQPTYGWATVTSVSPLQIRYDGQADPVVGAPSGDTAGLRVGDRVWCQRIHRRDIVLVNRRSGRPYAMAAGTVAVPGGNGEITSATVTFPAGRFSVPPSVTQSANTGAPGIVQEVTHADKTAVSVTFYMLRNSATSTQIDWQAVQMTPTSASTLR